MAAGIHGEMVQLYWKIGRRVHQDILHEKRAEYSQKIIENLAKQLTTNYGRGYSRPNLFRMIRFAEVYPAWEIVQNICVNLSWSHLCILIFIEDELKRDFYLEMGRIEKWSVRTLQEKMAGMLFERTAISRKPRELIRRELDELRKKDSLSQDFIFKDPYLLGFLGLEDTYSEKDLENSILHKLEGFLLELGTDFTFVGRQKRIIVDNEDYYIDLLFYHRGLCALVVIEIKTR